jgi:hypothetical protein
MLGPFEVRDDGAAADVPGDRLRALLIALALEPGRVVQRATLVDWIWGEHPPADAANALQRLVSRLRKVLPEGSIEGQTGGYRLVVDPDNVDAVRFERLVGQGRDDARRSASGGCGKPSRCGAARPCRTSNCPTAPRSTPRSPGSNGCGSPRWRSGTTRRSPLATAPTWSKS